MPGDVGLVAALLTKALGYATDADGYEQWSREQKLTKLMEALDVAIVAHDQSTTDALFDEYRWLRQQTGP